jgi:NAD(P)H-dependent flavin oxidoreductase YrpB (nitropropane dioxygenase family)
MLHTALCDLLDIRHPIIQGGMGPNDTTDLAIAVCRAGGLGTISSSLVDRDGDAYEHTRRTIQRVKTATDSSFAVNQVIKGTEAQERIRAVVDERRDDPEVRRRLKAVITSGGNPAVVATALRESGVLHIHVVPSVYHARKAVASGCGAVIAEGYESGGHIAYEPVHTLVLLPAVVDAVAVPVIAAGGFCDGRGLAAALALGAAGIQMGTRFYLSREASQDGGFAHPADQGALFAARETDTLVVPGVYGPNRHWRNPRGVELARLAAAGAPHEEIEHLKEEGLEAKLAGDLERAAVPIGMVMGRIDQPLGVAEIVERTVSDAEQTIARLQQRVRSTVV